MEKLKNMYKKKAGKKKENRIEVKGKKTKEKSKHAKMQRVKWR